MRVSCGCPRGATPSELLQWIIEHGLQPTVTDTVIRCVYEGKNRTLGEAIVERFKQEPNHDVTVFYDKDEQDKSARRAERKARRAAKNAKLHGH